MAGTRILDWVTGYARERGAVVRLIGDPAQLTSVEAGGALRLIASDTGAVELSDLHRFANPAEARATIALREGRAEALEFYRANDRISSGSADALLEAAYDAWSSDTQSGLTSLLVAGSTRDVTALNTRARLERIAAGTVTEAGANLQDGTRAGVGDHIVTRRNHRRLTDKRAASFVKNNGDTWTVTRHHHNGDLTVTRTGAPLSPARSRGIRLPADYVAAHVELTHATTTARAQGRTVDTAHVLVDDTLTRESLYVAATRGRDKTCLYVQTEQLLDTNAERPPHSTPEPTDVLHAILESRSAEISATEVQRENRRQRTAPRTPRQPTKVPPPTQQSLLAR